jgi:hypothetical protein
MSDVSPVVNSFGIAADVGQTIKVDMDGGLAETSGKAKAGR